MDRGTLKAGIDLKIWDENRLLGVGSCVFEAIPGIGLAFRL